MIGSIEKIVGYVIPIAVLVFLMLYMYGGTGALQDVKEKVVGFADKYIDIGKEEISAQASLTGTQKGDLSALKASLQKIVQSDKKNCFYNYGGLEDFGEDNNLEITMTYTGNGTQIYVKGGASTAQYITSENFFIEGMKPCVIGGSSLVTSNFIDKFLKSSSSMVSGYYTPVNGIKITYESAVSRFDENRIDYGGGLMDFEGHEWLFSPDNEHICFFPTVDTWSDADGLNDDYLVDTNQKTSVPYKYSGGMLTKCFQ